MSVSLDKDTLLCISIASRPGSFGTVIHNAAFQECNLNYIYKACEVNNLSNAINGIRALGIRGCGVSMPFKESVIPLLDQLDPSAREVGAVNTIVNTNDVLTGYNTDVYGVSVSLKEADVSPELEVLLVGAGGIAKAILESLKAAGFRKITICNRSIRRAEEIAKKHSVNIIEFERLQDYNADFLINATSIGMYPDIEQCIFSDHQISQAQVIMDVPTNPLRTRLMSLGENHGATIIPGHLISLHQAARQFELYTSHKAPLSAMKASLMNHFSLED